MILTLENAELINQTYFWRFPKMKYTASINSITTPETYVSISVLVKDTTFLEKLFTGTYLQLTDEFEGDYFRASFTKLGQGSGPILPTELTIELTEILDGQLARETPTESASETTEPTV
jgi:hypothetical protein